MNECRIEGFICRLCSQIDRNVIHIYSDEGLLIYLCVKQNDLTRRPSSSRTSKEARAEDQRIFKDQRKLISSTPYIKVIFNDF